MKIIKFKLTENHIKLLRSVYVGWDDCEFGAPAIDCKRPYGNSDVLEDIHRILTGKEIGRDGQPDSLTHNQEEKYQKLHSETQTALQIILTTGSFVPGIYEADEYGFRWYLKKKIE